MHLLEILLAGISALNFCFFLWIAKRFVYKKLDEDDVPEEKESGAINRDTGEEII